MDTTWNAKNAVRAKVAFLVIFVAALISARVIVAMRSAVVLSEPIRLAYAGLSVSMPQGNGWNSAKKWEYKQDTFILFGAFAPGSSRPTASARCDYVFPNEIIDLEERFERRQRETGGEIVEKGQIRTGLVTIDWVRIEQTMPRLITYSARRNCPTTGASISKCARPPQTWIWPEAFSKPSQSLLASRTAR